jgi:hypothetical protein
VVNVTLSLPLDLTCARCQAMGMRVEVVLPEHLQAGQARAGVTILCPACENHVIYGELPAQVTA